MTFLAEIASPDALTWVFLILALVLALGFEFVNGFHDTANAVATVIYTHTLRPTTAVVWSGIWNLIGVLASSGAVAYGIVSLLPVELVLNVGSGAGFAMVFALLISAIIWNLGTWYLGLPASSSHTLIGSILGVGIGNAVMSGKAFGAGINWSKAQEIGLSLLISPLFGFCCAGLLLLLLKLLARSPQLFTEPEKGKAPPMWIRAILMITCTGVSFAHGSNDGQKGMGLMVLILVGILPGTYALKMSEPRENIQTIVVEARAAQAVFAKHAEGVHMEEAAAVEELSSYVKPTGQLTPATFAALTTASETVATQLGAIQSFSDLGPKERADLRTDIYLMATAIAKIEKGKKLPNPDESKPVAALKKDLERVTKYIPDWVKYAVALALGTGTMIGWKRIVITVGEKIGKSHLTYGQGASAELVAMCTILAADTYGLPVSTTHVLSSGIAGTMAANRSGLQAQTLRNILLAWVLTLPVCILLGSFLFALGNFVVLHILGVR